MEIFSIFSIFLFFIGSFGMFLSKKHVINILISMELLVLSININFIVYSIYLDDLLGQIYSLIILTSAAGEIAIGLAIIIMYHRLRGGISVDLINLLKS